MDVPADTIENGAPESVPAPGSERLLQQTTTVSAQLGVAFGVRCRLSGNAGASGELTVRLLMPVTVTDWSRVQTPTRNWVLQHAIGEAVLVGFRFARVADFIPGQWTIEVSSGPHDPVSQSFTVVRPALPSADD